MIDAEEIRSRVDEHSLILDIDRVPRGHLRVQTGFLYPDGSSVDVFIVENPDLFTKIRLSDLGQTTAWLMNVQVKPWMSKKRKALLEDAIRLYSVEQAGGALQTQLDGIDEVADGIFRLAQACVRVADLTFTRRSSLQSVFSEEVEEVLADSDLVYQPNFEIPGRFGRPVRVDFLVEGRRSQSGVLIWSSANPSAAHSQANEILRRWLDLDYPRGLPQRVTVFDDRLSAYRDDDMQRLENLSYVYPLSDRQSVVDLVAA